MRSKLLFFIKFFISSFILSLLFYFIDIALVYKSMASIGSYNFIILMLLTLALLLMQTLRLHTIVSHFTKKYKKTLELSLVSQFFSTFLPGAISGDIYKVIVLKKQKVSLAGATTLIALDRIIGLFWVLFFGLIYILLPSSVNLELSLLYVDVFYMLLLVTVLSIASIHFYKKYDKLRDKVLSIIDDIKSDIGLLSKKQLYLFIFVSLVVFFGRLLKFYILIRMLNQSLDFVNLFLVVFLVQLAGMIPLSLGGLGIIEASLVYALGLFGIPNIIALSVALLNRVSVLLFSVLGGLVWLSIKNSGDR